MLRTKHAYIYIYINYASQRLRMYSFCRFQISKNSDQIESNRNRFGKKSNRHRFDSKVAKTRPNRTIPRRTQNTVSFSQRSTQNKDDDETERTWNMNLQYDEEEVDE